MPNNNLTPKELSDRTARFGELEPMSTAKDLAHIPQAAMDIVFARKLMPVILDGTKNPFGDTASIYGAAESTMFISVCLPGQGALLAFTRSYL